MANVTLSTDEYELLLDYGYDRKTDQLALRELQRRIDRNNNIKRYLLNIRWMEMGGQAPTRIEIKNGTNWPPEQTTILRQNRPIAREDVDLVLRNQAKNPVYVTVTGDERGLVGWTELAAWDFALNV